MTILMEALKQQTGAAVSATPSGRGWRYLALILGIMVALLIGFIAGYWVLSQQRSLPVTEVSMPVPASSVDIMQVLLASEPVVTLSVLPEVSSRTAATPSEVQPEVFEPLPPVVTVTANPVQTVQPELDMTDVSADLQERFARAVAETEQVAPTQNIRTHNAPARDISMLDEQLQRRIPPLEFEAHVYASSPAQRWIKVNGKTLQEGQWITADIRVKEITPQYVLLELGSQLFSVSALSDWSYR